MLEPWALRHKWWKKRLAWWLYQRRDLIQAKCLHATSVEEAAQFRKLGLKQAITILPNGVRMPENLKKERSMTPGKRQALFLSRLHPKKGLEILVDAWARLRPAGWIMKVVGPDEGDYRRKIMAAVDRASLNDDWIFEEMAEGADKWRHFLQSDLFVLPSFSENFGIVVAEALVAGVPVITTTGTPWEKLPEEKMGWWIDPTTDAITEALKQAMSLPPDDLRIMGERGISWARNEFEWPSIASRMAKVYHWTVNGGVRPNEVMI